MRTRSPLLLSLCLALAMPALAQRRPGPPGGPPPIIPGRPAPPSPLGAPLPPPGGAGGTPPAASGDREITPKGTGEQTGEGRRVIPDCDEAKRKAKYNIYFD